VNISKCTGIPITGGSTFEKAFKNIDDILWKDRGASSEPDYQVNLKAEQEIGESPKGHAVICCEDNTDLKRCIHSTILKRSIRQGRQEDGKTN
jgi:hypothetical protein